MKTNLIGLLLLGFLLGCGSRVGSTPPNSSQEIMPPPDILPQQPNVASLDPRNWYIYYSAGVPAHPSASGEGAWSFNFPDSLTGGHVNYVQTPFSATTTPHNVSMTFKVESNAAQYAVYDPTDILPATLHLFIEQEGDDLVNPNGRWWAAASAYFLGSQDNQTITTVVPLTYDQWSNVYGEHDSVAFPAALANIGWVGLTFGGEFFWGHGAAVSSGSAKFVLIDFQVN